MKTVTEAEITVEEIEEAVKQWLHARRIAVDGRVHWKIREIPDPEDWQARNAPDYGLAGATFKVGIWIKDADR